MLKLFYAKGTISIAVAIGLEEAGLPYDTVGVDFSTGEQTKPEYLAINPKGRVPALVTDSGAILTETGALLDYIAACAPEAGLIPADKESAAHMRSVMYYLASTMHVAHAHKIRGSRWARQQSSFDDMAAKVTENVTECAVYVQENCLRGDFVCGETLTIADVYLFMVCSWLEGDGVTLSDFPTIQTYLNRMEARPSVQTMRARDML